VSAAACGSARVAFALRLLRRTCVFVCFVCLRLTGRIRCAPPVVQPCAPDQCSAHAGAHACTAELEVLPRWSTVESFAPMRQPELVRRPGPNTPEPAGPKPPNPLSAENASLNPKP
jgi:hypothetical protein